jgi:predicted dehydrogenase
VAATKPTYRVAIIGTGRMGGLTEDEPHTATFPRPFSHIAAYQAIEQTEVVAVANRGEARLRRFAERFDIPPEKTYLDYGAGSRPASSPTGASTST